MKRVLNEKTQFIAILGCLIMVLLLCCTFLNMSEKPCYGEGESVSVTIYNDNGGLIESATVPNGGSFTPPTLANQSGLSFLGWYSASEGGEIVDFVELTEDVSAYARYKAVDFSESTIVFDTGVVYDGINGATAEITVTHDFVDAEDISYSWYKFVEGVETPLSESGSSFTIYNCSESGTYKGKAEAEIVSQSGKVYTIQFHNTAYLGITKCLFDMTGIHFNDKEAPYTGEYIGIELTYDEGVTLPIGIGVHYGGGKRDIGVYTLQVDFTVPDTENYEPLSSMTAVLTITKGNLGSIVTFPSKACDYTGEELFLSVENLPSGCGARYQVNGEPFLGAVDAGSYQIEALINGGDNFHNHSITAVLTINKVVPYLSVIANNYTYSGERIYPQVYSNSDGEVSCEDIALVNAGEYVVTISVAEGKNHLASNEEVKIVIGKAEYSVTDIIFNNSTVIYDKKIHRHTVSGNIPSGSSVSYLGGGTDVGEYLITARISGNPNYHDKELNSKLTIKPKEIEVVFDLTKRLVADGSEKTVTAEAVPIAGDRLNITVRSLDDKPIIEAGIYRIKAVTPNKNYSLLDNEAELTVYSPSLTSSTGSTVAVSEGVVSDVKLIAEFGNAPALYEGAIKSFGAESKAVLFVCYFENTEKVTNESFAVNALLSDNIKNTLKDCVIENVVVMVNGNPIMVKNLKVGEDDISFESGKLGDFLIIYREKTFFELLPLWSYVAFGFGIIVLCCVIILIVSARSPQQKPEKEEESQPIDENVVLFKDGRELLMPEKAMKKGIIPPKDLY